MTNQRNLPYVDEGQRIWTLGSGLWWGKLQVEVNPEQKHKGMMY